MSTIQWLIFAQVNVILFFLSSLRMTSEKARSVEQRLNNFIAQNGIGPFLPLAGGTITGPLAVTGNITGSGDIHVGAGKTLFVDNVEVTAGTGGIVLFNATSIKCVNIETTNDVVCDVNLSVGGSVIGGLVLSNPGNINVQGGDVDINAGFHFIANGTNLTVP